MSVCTLTLNGMDLNLLGQLSQQAVLSLPRMSETGLPLTRRERDRLTPVEVDLCPKVTAVVGAPWTNRNWLARRIGLWMTWVDLRPELPYQGFVVDVQKRPRVIFLAVVTLDGTADTVRIPWRDWHRALRARRAAGFVPFKPEWDTTQVWGHTPVELTYRAQPGSVVHTLEN